MSSHDTSLRASTAVRGGAPPSVAEGASIADDAATRQVTLDHINLEQALRDFEIANRRVVDLTQRLLDVTEEARALRTELESLRIDHTRLLATNHEAHVALQSMRASRTYALMRAVGAARRIARR